MDRVVQLSLTARRSRGSTAAAVSAPSGPLHTPNPPKHSHRFADLPLSDPTAGAAAPVQRAIVSGSAVGSSGSSYGAGLPSALKTGIRQLSGISLDHTQVRYNSGRPGQIGAAAYAQGRTIHLAPGQEHHLPHEAWHLVQQRQGRVRPTLQTRGVAINDDPALEREADTMGRRARQVHSAAASVGRDAQAQASNTTVPGRGDPGRSTVVQRDITYNGTHFVKEGRVDGHDSDRNKAVLSERIHLRAHNNDPNSDEINNEHETALYQKHGANYHKDGKSFIAGNLKDEKLAICHKMSDHTIQEKLIEAAHKKDWSVIEQMVGAINSDKSISDKSNIAVKEHYTNASQYLKHFKAGQNITAQNLTSLAKFIANSPANLFVGNQSNNGSISSNRDFNSFAPQGQSAGTAANTGAAAAAASSAKPTLVRTRTYHSELIDEIAGKHFPTVSQSLALQSGPNTKRSKAARQADAQSQMSSSAPPTNPFVIAASNTAAGPPAPLVQTGQSAPQSVALAQVPATQPNHLLAQLAFHHLQQLHLQQIYQQQQHQQMLAQLAHQQFMQQQHQQMLAQQNWQFPQQMPQPMFALHQPQMQMQQQHPQMLPQQNGQFPQQMPQPMFALHQPQMQMQQQHPQMLPQQNGQFPQQMPQPMFALHQPQMQQQHPQMPPQQNAQQQQQQPMLVQQAAALQQYAQQSFQNLHTN